MSYHPSGEEAELINNGQRLDRANEKLDRIIELLEWLIKDTLSAREDDGNFHP